MSLELLNTNQVNATRNLWDQFSIVKEELFDCFLEWMWEKKSNWMKILAIFWIILAHFDKESLKIGKKIDEKDEKSPKIEKSYLIEFISSFLRKMEIDEVNIRKFVKIYLQYLIYKNMKDISDRVIEKISRKERSIQLY